LKVASRWASEQLVGLASSADDAMTMNGETQTYSSDNNLTDIEIYAFSLFDMGEYSRCAYVLSSQNKDDNTGNSFGSISQPRRNLTPTGIYLRAFSLYLEGERRKEEEVAELRDPLERTSVKNGNLERLEVELKRCHRLGTLDAFGLYVYGVVLKGLRGKKEQTKEEKGEDEAHEIFIKSILKYPYNWSAWLDLAEICVEDPSIDQAVERLLQPLSGHWMYHFFCVHVFIENKSNENAIAVIDKLVHGNVEEDSDNITSGFFVQSAYLQTQLAMAYYDVRDYDSAHEHFLALSEREPHRLDNMDAFSNVLYVKDQKVALSHLAHRSVAVDKFRPETCIIVGNYYSSKGRHEKAVQYFQRALKLNRNYLSAWTLLGHEYIEMKNTPAAIEAYRRAVDISDREYRAWYGLGQTYEIMNMLLHALFYFRKAAALHPHDARMWCAIGGCLLGLERRSDAEKSYERAVSLGDGEGIATRKLAELYREDGDEEKAAKCYLRHLELRYHSQLSGPFTGPSADSSPAALENIVKHVRVDEPEAEALLYLACYYRDNLEYDVAILCATRLEDYPGPEKEMGKSLLRDIRSRMDQQDAKRPGYPPRSPVTPAMNNARGARSTDLSMDATSIANAESSFEFSP
jgi:anaphase-promoting complex subunit 8